jgi:hypothetical protein
MITYLLILHVLIAEQPHQSIAIDHDLTYEECEKAPTERT